MKTLQEIKKDWIIHNLENGLSTNELTLLINEVWNTATYAATVKIKIREVTK